MLAEGDSDGEFEGELLGDLLGLTDGETEADGDSEGEFEGDSELPPEVVKLVVVTHSVEPSLSTHKTAAAAFPPEAVLYHPISINIYSLVQVKALTDLPLFPV